MKKFSIVTKYMLALLIIPVFLFAQIPNPGFEQWTAGYPDGWLTNNNPAIGNPITQSGTSHSGSSAAKGAVLGVIGGAYPPILSSMTFPISQRYSTFSGYYQFAPVGGDIFYISILLFNNQNLIAEGNLAIGSSAAAYTQFNAGIQYFSTETPDTAIIQFGISDSVATPDVGSAFLVDDLQLSGLVAIPEPVDLTVPWEFALAQNFPNPFNPETTIKFSLPESREVSLIIYNSLGQEVARLVDGRELTAGKYSMNWNAGDLPSGIYFYRLTAGQFSQMRKMVLMK
jgi:hypothetical protein